MINGWRREPLKLVSASGSGGRRVRVAKSPCGWMLKLTSRSAWRQIRVDSGCVLRPECRCCCCCNICCCFACCWHRCGVPTGGMCDIAPAAEKTAWRAAAVRAGPGPTASARAEALQVPCPDSAPPLAMPRASVRWRCAKLVARRRGYSVWMRARLYT